MLEPISAWVPFTPGTPVRLTSQLANPAARLEAHAILIQQCPGNTKPIYVYNRPDGLVDGSLGSSVIIPAPTYNDSGDPIILPHAVFSIPGTGNAEDVSHYWADSEAAGYVAVSVLYL